MNRHHFSSSEITFIQRRVIQNSRFQNLTRVTMRKTLEVLHLLTKNLLLFFP